jgi:hypothetical protein
MTDMELILDDAFRRVIGYVPGETKPDRHVKPSEKPKFRQVRRLVWEGYGIDDVRAKTGLSYLVIWGSLKHARRCRYFRPYERIALIRASYERAAA